MKFRILSDEELKVFEEDLKHFLIANGIDGSSWEKINKEDPEKAIDLIGIFSDTILQKVYERIRFLEFRSKEKCFVFRLGAEQIELIALDGSDKVDFSAPESIHKALIDHPEEIKFFKTAKNYTLQREMEIHKMLNDGCVPSHEAFWIQLNNVIND